MLKIGILCDDIASFDIAVDTTFALMVEAQSRGHDLWAILPNDIYFLKNKYLCRARKISLKEKQGEHVVFSDPEIIDLKDGFDLILMRQDPPFDMHYVSLTHLLDEVNKSTKVINNPTGVRNAPEKISALQYLNFHPNTAIAFSKENILSSISAISNGNKDFILKPLFGNGGEGVILLKAEDPNINSLVDILMQRYIRQPIIVQEYLPNVSKGDKRIILIDGNPVGALDRIPQKGDLRANLHVGGKAKLASISKEEAIICEALKGFLKENGLFLAGIDIIDGMLTEINVTSPTGFCEINNLGGANLSKIFWNSLESI